MLPRKLSSRFGIRDGVISGVGGRNNGMNVVGMNEHALESHNISVRGLVGGDVYGQAQQPYIPIPGAPSSSMFYTNNANQIRKGQQTQSAINNMNAIARRDDFGSRR